MAAITVQEIVVEVRIAEDKLKEKCSDEHLVAISSLGLDWRVAAPHLGLSGSEIDDIDQEGKKEQEKRRKVLEKWRQKYAFKATYTMLVEVLLKIGRADQAVDVCRLLRRASEDNSNEPPAPKKPKLLPGKLTRRDRKTKTELHTADKATQTENKESEAGCKKSSLQSGELALQSLTWKQGKLAPLPLHKGTAAVHGNKAYFIGADSSTIQEYDIVTGEWEGDIECEYEGPALVFIGDLLTAVGGHKKHAQGQVPSHLDQTNAHCQKEDDVTNKLMSIDLQKPDQGWLEEYPRMLTKKVLPQAVCAGEYLIALGKKAGYEEIAVEVMNTSPPYQWQRAKGPTIQQAQLSKSTYRSSIVCRDKLFLATDDSVAYAHLKDVIESCATVDNPVRKKLVWRETPYPKDLTPPKNPSSNHFVFTTLVALEDHLLCLSHEHRYGNPFLNYSRILVYPPRHESRLRLDIYDPQKGWTCLAISDLEDHADFCDGIATALPGRQLSIVGGRRCHDIIPLFLLHKNVYLVSVDFGL